MLLLAKWFTKRPAVRRPVRSFRSTFESLESRELLSGTPLTPPADLHNATIKSVAQAEFLQDNGRLSRTDVINLLEVVDGTEKAVFTNGKVSFTSATPIATAAVSSAELTDLRTWVHDAALWGLSADVSNLACKVVNQNDANVYYKGVVLLPSGDLAAGDKDSVLQDLVEKWFYGTDLPAVSTAAAANGIPGTVVYEDARGVLFGPNGPRSNDIAQGWVGDCYFLSSLGETAQQSPQTIQNMITDNHDGTYTVRFYQLDAHNDACQPDYVTVNLELPVLKQSGQFAFADWCQGGKPTTSTDTSAVLWPALVEKAYAQLAAEGWSRAQNAGGSGVNGTPSDWNQNSYNALAYGNGVALQQITGSSSTFDVGLRSAGSKDESTLLQAFSHGSLVIFGSLSQEPAGTPTNPAGAPLIISGHVYALKSVDTTTGTFTLVNPYDDSSVYSTDGQRTATLTWAQLKEYLNDAFVVAPPPIDPAHAVMQNGSSSGINGGALVVNLEWFDNGKRISSPSQAHEGDTITVTFDTLPGAAPTEFSLVSYAAPNGNFTNSNIDHQQEWGDSTATYTGAGQHSLTVTLPDGYFQLDFVTGAAISDFATGERYHSEGRFIAGSHGGDHLV